MDSVIITICTSPIEGFLKSPHCLAPDLTECARAWCVFGVFVTGNYTGSSGVLKGRCVGSTSFSQIVDSCSESIVVIWSNEKRTQMSSVFN